jgi:hypothetical protein
MHFHLRAFKQVALLFVQLFKFVRQACSYKLQDITDDDDVVPQWHNAPVILLESPSNISDI